MTTFYQPFCFFHHCAWWVISAAQTVLMSPRACISPIMTFGTLSHWSCCWLPSVGVKKEKRKAEKTLPTLRRLSLSTDKHTLFWVINHVLKTDWYWMQPGLYSHWSIDLTTRNNTKLHWNLKVHNINRFPQGQNKRVNNKSNLNLIRRIACSWTYKVKIW